MARFRATILRFAIVGVLFCVAMIARSVWSARTELLAAERAISSNDEVAAIVHLRRAAKWRAPLNIYAERAVDRLGDMARSKPDHRARQVLAEVDGATRSAFSTVSLHSRKSPGNAIWLIAAGFFLWISASLATFRFGIAEDGRLQKVFLPWAAVATSGLAAVFWGARLYH